ncbi:hypothetical protein CSKR_105276, partial [Clonorchis sinensis]
NQPTAPMTFTKQRFRKTLSTEMKKALEEAFVKVSRNQSSGLDAQSTWISDRTVALLKSRRNIAAGPEHNLMRRIIGLKVKLSVRADREV